MFKDSYYQVRIKLDSGKHNLFPYLLDEAYAGSFAEEDDSWILSVMDNEELETLLRKVKELQSNYEIRYHIKQKPVSNWNALWESGLKPIRIPPKLQVCMYSIQEEEGYDHSIYIQGLNAFGTGHHETTAGVLRLMLDFDFKSKTVLDLGCGTGILGILAMKLGAEHVEFIDNDMKAIQSTIANLSRNVAGHGYSLVTGTLEQSRKKHYDVIIGNIYRSVLIQNSNLLMQRSDDLFLSGYKNSALEDMHNTFLQENWQMVSSNEENSWMAEHYSRRNVTE